jgi:hypothetical protein
MSDKTYKEQRKEWRKAQRREWRRTRKRGSGVLAGLVLLIVGCVLLLHELKLATFPGWFFTWPMILIAFGLFAGAGNAFRDPGWVIITGVGAAFLVKEAWHTDIIHLWPVLIVMAGLLFILGRRRHHKWHARLDEEWNKYYNTSPPQWQPPVPPDNLQPVNPVMTEDAKRNDRSSGNWLDIVSIFGNIKKTVYTKEFQGGDVVSIFGGAEVNLTQADFEGKIVIEMVQIFGGAKLIVPAHWQIQSQMVAVFGGIEDKRPPQASYDSSKILVLNGTTFFGGIEIKSY